MFVTLAALIAVQAGSPDADIACILDRIPASARAAVIAEAGSGMPGPVRQAFVDAGLACARERSWSPDFAASVGMRAAGMVLREQAAAALLRAGVATGPIDRWIEALPAAQRNMDSLSEARMDELFDAIIAAGVTRETVEARAADIGLYVGARFAELELAAGRRP